MPGERAPLVRRDVAERDAQAPPDHGPPLPLRRRAAFAGLLLAVTVPIELWVIVTDLGYLDVANRLLGNEFITRSEFEDAEDAVTASSVAQFATYVVTAVFFLFWFARAYYNLPRFSLGGLRFGRGWSIGAWFVPFLNLVRPKGIANDIWRGSSAAAEGESGAWKGRDVNPLLHWWWGLWLGTSILSQVASRLFINDGLRDTVSREEALDALREERIGFWLDIAASGLSIAAAVLALLMVRKITALQDRALARRQG